MLFSIFMASSTTSVCPAAIVSPAATFTLSTVPGRGHFTLYPDEGAAAAMRGEGVAELGVIMALFADLGAGATWGLETVGAFAPSISTS